MRLKICGLTKPDQCLALARLGVHALGFICVPASKRFVTVEHLRQLTAGLPPFVARIGVFADTPLAEIVATVQRANLSGIQLHGNESPALCAALRVALPAHELIKAIRLRDPQQLTDLADYWPYVTAVLLDAYQPNLLGGTGQVLDWTALQNFCPPKPWILAGGLTPENIDMALGMLAPDALDLSSGVERAAGDKDLARVALLWQKIGAVNCP